MRRRDIVTVVPRSGETATAAGLAAEGAAAAGAGAEYVGAAGFESASTSSRRIRPPIPVPFTFARFTPSSLASLRTRGVTYASTGCVIGAAATGAGAETTGATATGAATTGAATTGAGFGAAGAATGAAPLVPINPRRAPTGTVVSTATSIANRVPATGEGISVSTLSVETSSNASSTATESPIFFSQRVTVPSLTLSPNAGIVITVPAPDAAGAAATGATGAGAAATGAAGGGVTGAAGAAATGADGAGAAAPSAMIANSAPTGTV